MNTDIPDYLNNMLLGWDDAILLRILFCLSGAAILSVLSRNILRRQVSVVSVMLWGLLGIFLFAFGVNPEKIIKAVITVDHFTRVRVIFGGLSLLVLAITFESIRRTHLLERYAILWLATGLIVFVSVLFPHLVDFMRALMGMEFTVAVVAVVFLFLVFVAFHYSIALSRMEDNQSRSAQEHAVLETRVRELETMLADKKSSTEDRASETSDPPT